MNDTYLQNIPASASPDVCPIGQSTFSDDELQAQFPQKLSNSTLTPDETTGRIAVSALSNHYQNLLTSGAIKITPQIIVGTGDTATSENDTLQQQKNDAELYNKFREEYCFYEQRYRYALKLFLGKSTSRNTADNADAQKYLGFTITLNRTLNSLIEIMNYAASLRVDTTNSYVASINSINGDIERRRIALQNVADMLTKNNATLTVQKEMVGFTSEKNRYATNQISIWAALNVLALATIFYVYRSA